MVSISITTWGGTFVLVTGSFDRVHSRFIVATRPLEDRTTLCEGIVFGPKGANPVARALEPLTLWVRRLFTYGYLKDETRRLRGTQYRPMSLGANDRDMIEYFQWLVALPYSEDALTAPDGPPPVVATP